MIKADVVIAFVVSIINWMAPSFAKNPRKGGSPPRDISLTIKKVLVVLFHLNLRI